jgi:hypothetical protein
MSYIKTLILEYKTRARNQEAWVVYGLVEQ